MNRKNKLFLWVLVGVAITVITIIVYFAPHGNSTNQSAVKVEIAKSSPTPKPEWDLRFFKIIEGIVTGVNTGIYVNNDYYTKIIYHLGKLDYNCPREIWIKGLPTDQVIYLNQKSRIIYCYASDSLGGGLGIRKTELME